MPKLVANNITMNYDQQGTGEPLILIPYLAADHACYAFQVPEYARHFTCISVDLRGTGESDKPQSGPVNDAGAMRSQSRPTADPPRVPSPRRPGLPPGSLPRRTTRG
jgi:pimeloyl-ACP methyl ester carboxylesterase